MMGGIPPEPPPPADGRIARSVRARAAIVDALLALLEEGNLQPSAPQVAERAGVSLRLVFHHFSDMESVFREAFLVFFRRRILPFKDAFPTGDGPFAKRLKQFVSTRAKMYETVSSVRRAVELMEPFSPTLQGDLTQGRKANAAEALQAFGPELEALPKGVRGAVTQALIVLTSFAGWQTLRRDQRLSAESSEAALTEGIHRLLGAE
jgi:TetR/AcrR family transcriptional regulator, regulator of autoinduction and epiphytic fitness